MAIRGQTLFLLGEEAEGLEDLQSARMIFQAEVVRTGQNDLKQDLAWLEQQLAKHMLAE